MPNVISGKVGRQLVIAGAAILIGAGISGCAGSRFAGDNTQAPRTASESCSIGMTYEWDDTRGSDTPAGAVADILESFTKAQESLPSDAPRSTIDSMADPVRLRVAVRGLEALMVEAQDTVVSDKTGAVAIEAKSPEGTPLAYALVFEAAGGGYRVSDFSAVGWSDDDPTCR